MGKTIPYMAFLSVFGPLHPSLGAYRPPMAVLDCLRSHGSNAALELCNRLRTPRTPVQPLLEELYLRLVGAPGPRILLDGLWFTRPHGGITRVWEQILNCWLLPGLISFKSPIALIERNSHLAITGRFENINGSSVDPLDIGAVAKIAKENAKYAGDWGASVFTSSWLSVCAQDVYKCPELHLVHDCLPERLSKDPVLLAQRRRCSNGASELIAVSKASAQDLEFFLEKQKSSIAWCHPGVQPIFADFCADVSSNEFWCQLQQRSGLNHPYVLLPATSAPGSYKNPELVAAALAEHGLQQIQLVLSGLAAETHCATLLEQFPHLQGRCFAAGFTDLELAHAYNHALAVVLPSRIEGFGLPAIEALATGATVLVADSRGLREAGAGACPRFSASDPASLVSWLKLLLDQASSEWITPLLQRRAERRLQQLHPDLLGLTLLALSRRCSNGYDRANFYQNGIVCTNF